MKQVTEWYHATALKHFTLIVAGCLLIQTGPTRLGRKVISCAKDGQGADPRKFLNERIHEYSK